MTTTPPVTPPSGHAPQDTGFWETLGHALRNLCPRCHDGRIFATWSDLSPRDTCPVCALPLREHDNGDGPAVFLIFILGFLLVPLALLADAMFEIPLWVHGVLWTLVALVLCLAMLRPLKSYIIALQYKHLPRTFGQDGAQTEKPDQTDN